MKQSIISDKSKTFALHIIGLYDVLCRDQNEYVLSKQILRSGTSIGANVREALQGVSVPDFINKLGIALKESEETAYWLELLLESGKISEDMFSALYNENRELTKMLTSIIKTTRNKDVNK